jgi:hypothetical protein
MPGLGDPDLGDVFIDCGPGAKVCRVDLHRDLRKDHMPAVAALFERSIAVRVGEARVRLMSPEHHLREVITHFLRHGAVRPIWLCDIAALIEAASGDFDWGLCTGGDRRVAGWIAAGASLAARLLDSDLKRAPAFVADTETPPWIEDVVLREWARTVQNRSAAAVALPRFPRTLRDVVPWLRARWPNPVQATIVRRGSLRGGNRRLHQVTDFATRAVRWLGRLAAPRHQGPHQAHLQRAELR